MYTASAVTLVHNTHSSLLYDDEWLSSVVPVTFFLQLSCPAWAFTFASSVPNSLLVTSIGIFITCIYTKWCPLHFSIELLAEALGLFTEKHTYSLYVKSCLLNFRVEVPHTFVDGFLKFSLGILDGTYNGLRLFFCQPLSWSPSCLGWHS